SAAPWLEPGLRRWIARVNGNLLHDFVDGALVTRLLCPTRPERLAAHAMFDANSPLIASGLIHTAARDVAPHNPMTQELVPGDHLVGFLRGSEALSRALAGVARRIQPTVSLDSLSVPPVVGTRVFPLVRGYLALDVDNDLRRGPGGMDFPRGAAFVLV